MQKFSEQDYDRAIGELFRAAPSVQTAGFTDGAYKPGLEAMRRISAATGEGWKHYPCIHVAGTNGKGSVCSMIASVLSSRGLKTGIYTSPHLLDFRERMKICGPRGYFMIEKREVWDFLQKYGEQLKGLSFFEITTAMAFEWFAARKVDVALIETGLGGRLDSTNIITPVLSIISGIGLDHCALLGDSVGKIAAEKAGIFKPGVPALVWGKEEGSENVFREAARQTGSPLTFADMTASFPEEDSLPEMMDLRGPCQRRNLHTVLCALRLLDETLPGLSRGKHRALKAGRNVTETEAIAKTAVRTGFRGRWERLMEKPELICDIAHNPPALELNFSRLANLGRPLFIVFGIMADKDLDGIIPLFPAGARYYFCAPKTPRAMGADKLYSRVEAARPDLSSECSADIPAAIHDAVRDARLAGDDALVYVGGSTFVVAEALKILEK